MNFSNLRIAAKLWVAVSVIIIALLALVLWAGQRSAQVQDENAATQKLMTQRVGAATRWAGLTETNAARTQAMILSSEPAVEAAFKDIIAATTAEISKVQKSIEGMQLRPVDIAQMDKIAASRKTMIDLRGKARQMKADGQAAEATALVAGQYNPAVSSYLGNLQTFVKMQEQAATDAENESIAARAVTRQASIGAVVLIVLALLGGAWWLIRSIQLPLGEANRVAARIAEGDLSHTVVTARQDEFGDLLRSLMHMSQSLGRMVLQVRQSTDSIATASAEIASGNNDLSARTEQTASNLQQTAASMEQLTSTVRQSADSASQASGLAAQASSVAEKGGEVVRQVVDTMQDINQSSQKIADIIGVIDGIAFQTNILALNAAVEAARAGEQGRGFAVVASEVRSLAQRSAQAAKEIKGLIGDSVDKVASGARLVSEAGTTMGDIVQSVRRVSDIIGEITAAANEQSTGIGEVNQAVSNLDQMTQQNSALVEESAAAAQSLREQADQLAQAVAVFKVSGGVAAEAAPPTGMQRSDAPAAMPRAVPRAAPRAALPAARKPAASGARAVPAPVRSAVRGSAAATQPRPAPARAPTRSLAAPKAVASASTEGDWESF
ncbi:MAG: methyl-accepting chemotaxis protein [Rhodoferax sp.]|nr:methyl-accepting chemotaxis protein [Rhodoferax sp.]